MFTFRACFLNYIVYLTLDLDTTHKNFEWQVALWHGHTNCYPKFKPAWISRGYNRHIDLSDAIQQAKAIKLWSDHRKSMNKTNF